jgi:hypothetical protein
MSEVYVVMRDDHNDPRIHGVYSTPQYANNAVDSIGRGYAWYETHYLHEPPAPKIVSLFTATELAHNAVETDISNLQVLLKYLTIRVDILEAKEKERQRA